MADDLVRRSVAVHLDRTAIDLAHQPVGSDRHVTDRRLLVQVAEARLVCAQALVDAQPLRLGAGAGGEDTQNRQAARIVHALDVEDREVAEHRPARVDERHAAVALGLPNRESRVLRKPLLDGIGIVRHAALEHALARRACHRQLEVVEHAPAPPDRQRAKATAVAVELGDERVGDAEGLADAADERPKKLGAGRGLYAFDDLAQRRVFVEQGFAFNHLAGRHRPAIQAESGPSRPSPWERPSSSEARLSPKAPTPGSARVGLA